jgi:hypothetical protein
MPTLWSIHSYSVIWSIVCIASGFCVTCHFMSSDPSSGVFPDQSCLWKECGSQHPQQDVISSTWMEVNSEVHMFVVDDQDHPQITEIHAELLRLSGLMHDAGYMPCTEFVLDDVEEEKVFPLCHHSENLAIALGLLNTPPGTPL